ncbi:MAG: methyltransferase domain-containing protein [Patescibacteria group bacterium]
MKIDDGSKKTICNYAFLKKFLKNGKSSSKYSVDQIRFCIDNFSDCWKLWNQVRWDIAKEKNAGYSELKEYFGEEFKPYYDSSWAIAEKWVSLNPTTDEQIANFYKKNIDYISNLVIWHESGDRSITDDLLKKLVNKYNIQSVIDFGCGVGTDGIRFEKLGLDVAYVDYDCPSIDFLKWRIQKNNLKGVIYNVETDFEYPSHDLFWAIDVLEHLPDPIKIIEQIPQSTRLFVHRSMFNDTAFGRHPCHFNFDEGKLHKALEQEGFKLIEQGLLEIWQRKS